MKRRAPERPAGARPERRWQLNLAERLRAYLLAGIIVTAPISITLLIVWWVVRYFDTTIGSFIPDRYNPENYMPFSLPGIGLIAILLFFIIVGWFAAGIVGRTTMRMGESLLDRTPVVRAIYGTLKQFFETVLTQSKAFREVVLVEYPQAGSYALGFVTGTAGPLIQGTHPTDLVNVLIPMSPFPSSGFLLFVERSRLTRLDLTVEEGMRIVISGGVVTSPTRHEAPAEPVQLPEPELARG